jgi:transcriptional regulator of acetoin/glycerol metabolism
MLDATLDTADRPLPRRGDKRLTLRWLFPDPSRPPVPLSAGCRIGRDPSCLLVIDGPGVSRVHAELEVSGDVVVVRDAQSRNGTFIDGERIDSARVQAGSLLRIDGWIGLFEAGLESGSPGFGELGPGLFSGATLRLALEPVRRAARTNLPIILRGETGTGKEVVSRCIHEWSGRTGPFCAVNCAALPQQLVEGELFGYRRGAFTGAERNNPGHFRAAHEGTLLLDEVNELELATQAKLLRVLQERQVVPLGESRPVDIDVRVVVAAQRPISEAVARGEFREDLYMRLRGLEVDLPPLRERVGDVPLLFAQFLQQHSLQQHGAGSAPEVEGKLIEALCLYRWPGNVRELDLTTRRLLAVHGGEPRLLRSFLPAEMTERAAPRAAASPEDDLARLARLLKKHDGNLTQACSELGISRQRAYRLLNGVSVKDFMAQAPAGETK